MSNSQNSNRTMGITMPLFLVFLILKLTHVIDWSWWWVSAPLWIPTAVAAVFILAAVTLMVLPKR